MAEQLLHVTLKDGAGKRIERKVITISGKGIASLTFDIPDRVELKAVSFAAFVGTDYLSCLQHTSLPSAPVE